MATQEKQAKTIGRCHIDLPIMNFGMREKHLEVGQQGYCELFVETVWCMYVKRLFIFTLQV